MYACSNSAGRKRDEKRSECPKGNNMPASERDGEQAMDGWMDEREEEHNIRASYQGSFSSLLS